MAGCDVEVKASNGFKNSMSTRDNNRLWVEYASMMLNDVERASGSCRLLWPHGHWLPSSYVRYMLQMLTARCDVEVKASNGFKNSMSTRDNNRLWVEYASMMMLNDVERVSGSCRLLWPHGHWLPSSYIRYMLQMLTARCDVEVKASNGFKNSMSTRDNNRLWVEYASMMMLNDVERC